MHVVFKFGAATLEPDWFDYALEDVFSADWQLFQSQEPLQALSHVSLYGDRISVPVPGVLALVGIGLFVALRRRWRAVGILPAPYRNRMVQDTGPASAGPCFSGSLRSFSGAACRRDWHQKGTSGPRQSGPRGRERSSAPAASSQPVQWPSVDRPRKRLSRRLAAL